MSAAPTGPTAPMGPRTYSEYYGNAGLDPYEENYAALMMQFRTANNPPTGGDLRSAVGNSDPAYPAAFLGLYKDEAGEARYRVIHAVARFPSMIGRAPKLGVLLPRDPDEEPMVGFPNTLPMGWVNSPPYFSAATETGADLMNQKLLQMDKGNHDPPRHRLEDLALREAPHDEEPETTKLQRILPSTTGVPRRDPHTPKYRRPLAYADVYVDDFIALMQGPKSRQRRVMRVLLHTLDEIFRPLEPDDGPHRQEPASTKKLNKGDATWSTSKVVLGWLIDTVAGTISLPSHRYERLLEILDSIRPDMKRAGVKMWHRLLGELRSMMLAIPGARGLFSTLQHALKTDDRGKPHRVRLTTAVHQFLDDFRMLAGDLARRPARIAEILARLPSVVGTTDAAAPGMGGAAFLHTPTDVVPIVWREPFPAHIQRRLVSWSNLKGDITNSDLELAATVVHHDVITQAADVREHTIQSLHDNTPAQYWQRKGSTTTTGPAAYLLRLQSFHQRHYRYVARHDFLPAWMVTTTHSNVASIIQNG